MSMSQGTLPERGDDIPGYRTLGRWQTYLVEGPPYGKQQAVEGDVVLDVGMAHGA